MPSFPPVSAPSKPTLRPVRDDDRDFLHQVFTSAWQRAFAAANLPADIQQKLIDHQFQAQDLSYRQEFPDAEYSVIMIEGTPAGRLYLDRREKEIGLMEITLLPEYRNRKIGTGLIEEVLREAATAGKPVVLYVEKWNPEARRLYLRLGFEDDENLETHWKMRWIPDGSA